MINILQIILSSRLVVHQKNVLHFILNIMVYKKGVTFIVDDLGVNAKIFQINLLFVKVRKKTNVALALPSSGIAATILDGGRTTHSMFCLTLNLTRQETPVCKILKNHQRSSS